MAGGRSLGVKISAYRPERLTARLQDAMNDAILSVAACFRARMASA